MDDIALQKKCAYESLQQQLAEAQQKMRELEGRWKPVEESARKTFEIESLPILLNGGTRGQERLAQIIASWHAAEMKCATLQATLAERERVIQQQETTIRGYRHSVDIMGRNHDDRKAERDTARQDAARLRMLIFRLLNDLPTKRDWLDPDLEKALKGA